LPMNIGSQVRYKLEGLYSDVQTNGNTPDIYAALSASNIILFDNLNPISVLIKINYETFLSKHFIISNQVNFINYYGTKLKLFNE